MLVSEKVYLNEEDLTIASRTWSVYAAGEKYQIEDLLKSYFGHLDKLKPALEVHLKRFPDADTGLNDIEEQLIKIVKSGITKRFEIYSEFWKNTAIYGMGDAQIDIYIEKLAEQNHIMPILTLEFDTI